MLTGVKNTLKFVFRSLKYNIKACMEYKKSFLIQSIFMFVNNGFFIVFWLVVFNLNNGSINGVGLKDVLFLWAISPLAFGISFFFFGGGEDVNKHIISGSMDTYLLQPKSLITNMLVSRCIFSAFGDILYGLVIGIFAVENIFQYLGLIGFGILGSIFFTCTNLIVRMFSIWVGDVENIAHVYEITGLVTLTNYPEQIFGKAVKFLMYTVVPAMYVTHLPIRLLKSFDTNTLLLILLAAGIFILLTILMMKIVVKKYESGNSMALRG